jgi:hypothetical protein
MQISSQDLQTLFKASGVYTIYEDLTAQPQVTISPVVRVIVGYSRYGKFNCPVYIRKGDTTTAELIFGKDDKVLERKGSFFHKSIKHMLLEGDVIALNLWKLDNSVDSTGTPTTSADTAQYISLSADPLDTNGQAVTKLLASFYNKQKFWKIDRNYLLATRDVRDNAKLLTFTNLSQSPATVIVMKSDVRGFDITLKDWYENDAVPAYLNPSDLVSDTFLDVTIINGDFGSSKWSALSQDPIMGKYFDKAGIKAEKLKEFLSRREISVRDTFTGSIIPDFTDKNGTNKSLEFLVNSKSDVGGLVIAIDREQLDGYETGTNTGFIDLVGHRLIDNASVEAEFLSYKFNTVNDFAFAQKASINQLSVDSTGVTVSYQPKKINVVITSSNPLFASIKDSLEVGTLVKGSTTSTGTINGITLATVMLEVSAVTKTTGSVAFSLVSPLKDSETGTSGIFIDLSRVVTTAETLATTADITVGTPAVNTHFKFLVDKLDGSAKTTLVDYFYHAGDTPASVATAIITMVNNGTSLHGFTALAGSAAGKFKIVAPIGSGALANTWTFSGVLTSGTALFANTGTLLTGGVSAVYSFTFDLSQDFTFKSTNTMLAGAGSSLWAKWKAGTVKDGDKVVTSSTVSYVKFSELRDTTGAVNGTADYRKYLAVTVYSDVDLTLPIAMPAFGTYLTSTGITATGMVIQGTGGSISKDIAAIATSDKNFRVAIASEGDIKIGDRVIGLDTDGNKMLTRIIKISRIAVSSPTPNFLDVFTADKVYIVPNGAGNPVITVYKSYSKFAKNILPFYLSGFTPKEASMPNGTVARMNAIFNVLYTTNLSVALADPEMINFRYLVDSFSGGIESGYKSLLSRMVQKRQKCLGILNFPSMATFEKSQDPRFTSSPTAVDPLPILSVGYIKAGGNVDENPSFLFSLPEEQDGASFVGYFGPHLMFAGDTTPVPPAALISNNFIRKFSEGNPFKPVAGSRRGVITAPGFNLAGVEYKLTKDERGDMEELGVNPIYQKDNGDVVIYGVGTAYTKFKSVLNYLHARDTLISFEIDTEKLLDPYIFEYQDAELETQVRSVLGNYYEDKVNNVGCLKSFELIFDRNTTPDFLAREGVALVTVKVEFTDIAKRFINRIQLIRNTSVISGGFQAV